MHYYKNVIAVVVLVTNVNTIHWSSSVTASTRISSCVVYIKMTLFNTRIRCMKLVNKILTASHFEILLIKPWCYPILSSFLLVSSYVGIWMNSLWKMYLSEMLFSNVSANDDSYCRIMLLLLICLIEIGVNKQVLRGRGVHPFLCRWWNKRMYHFSKAPCVEITWFDILIGFR